MVTAAYFTELVKQSYIFLEDDFGFKYTDTDDDPRIIEVRYRKEDFMVLVRYSRANDYVDVRICDHASILQPQTLYKYCVMLMGLVRDRNSQVNYDAIMPKVIGLEESVKQTAALLKYYGNGILSAEEPIPH